MIFRKLMIAAISVCISVSCHAKTKRSSAAKAEFKRQHPCPSNGNRKGPCKGYVIDHITPLCAGGPDRPSNMQWQTVSDAKTKDRLERKMCR